MCYIQNIRHTIWSKAPGLVETISFTVLNSTLDGTMWEPRRGNSREQNGGTVSRELDNWQANRRYHQWLVVRVTKGGHRDISRKSFETEVR